MAPITLFHLPQTRSIRIAWLLEELQLPYEVVASERLPNFDSPPEFRAKVGGLGKVPTIHDGDMVVQESGAVTEYLCSTYPSPNPDHPLLPASPLALRFKVIEYIHLAEGTFLLHSTPLFYARRLLPESAQSDGTLAAISERVMAKVTEDLEWLEGELQAQKGKLGEGEGLFLVGKHLTAADVMMGFSVGLLLQRAVAVMQPGKRYRGIEQWLKGLKGREAYKKAAERLDFKGSILRDRSTTGGISAKVAL